MSYILNALKKAEHDRKREESEDLDDFVSAGWDPYQEPTKNSSGYKLALIIVAVAALLFYGFYSLTNQNISGVVAISEPQQAVEAAEDRNSCSKKLFSSQYFRARACNK